VIGATVLLGLAAGLLGGCANKTAQDYNPLILGQWRQIPARPENRVEAVRLEHIVAFQSNAIRLDEAERERLIEFARDGNLTLRDKIELHALPTLEGDYHPTTAARLDVLRGEFDQLGFKSDVARSPGPGAKGGQDQIAVVVRRAAIIPPDCEEVREPWAGQRPEYEFGCSTVSAIGLMVADPHDLAKGRSIDSPDGEVAASAVQRYRTESLTKKREFIKEGTGK
jgi:pilus assembly protein CpaD